MPRSGGTFTRTDGTRTGSTVWQQARDAGVKIVAAGADTHDEDIADALTASIANDGQTPILANLPMTTFRHTGVGDGAARTDYASAGQTQDGSLNWVDGGGTADAITATYAPVLTALIDGQLCHVRATTANATTAPTFSPNGLSAHTIVKEGGAALLAGDIIGDGHELVLRYDPANTQWELLNPKSTSNTGTVTSVATAGLATGGPITGTGTVTVTKATGAEIDTGMEDAKATTPKAVADAIGSSIAAQHITINAQTGTTYTTVLSDDGKLVTLSNAAAIALTIPTNASVAYPVGTTIAFQQIGAGLVTMSGGGVTFNNRNGLVSGGQNAVWSITKTATDTWAVAGDLTT